MPSFPIDEELEQGTVAIPLEEEKTPAEIHERGVSEVLVAKDQGRNPQEAYVRATASSDPADVKKQWNDRVQEDRTAIVGAKIEAEAPIDVVNELDTMTTNLSGDVNTGNYVETIKTMPSSEYQDEESIQREAIYMQMRETMADNLPDFEDMSWMEIAGNVGGVVLPKRRGYTVAKLAQAMGFEEGFADAADSFIDPVGTMIKMRRTFWAADEKGKVEFLNVLAHHLPEVTDNDFLRADILQGVLGQGYNDDLESFFEVLDTVDATMITKGVLHLLNGMRKSGKIINTVRRFKEADVEAEMIEEAVSNPEMAQKVGITPADVMDHQNPLIHGEVGNLLIGASEDQAAAVVKMVQMQDARFNAITKALSRSAVLDETEIQRVMKQAEDDILDIPDMIDVRTERIDETGFRLSYTEAYFDKLGRVRQRTGEKVVDFKVNDIGELQAPSDEWVEKFLAMDPNARMRGKLRQWFVTDVEKMSRSQEMTAKAFDGMMRDAFKPLGIKGDLTGISGSRSAAKVDRALRRGAKDARTFNYDELRAGEAGEKLSHKEAQAYIGARNVVDKLYELKNKQIVDQYLADGVKLWDGPEGIMPVKNYADAKAAETAWRQVKADSHHILIPERGLTLGGWTWEGGLVSLSGKAELTKEMIEEAYSKGYVLARNHNQAAFFKLGEHKTQWALVKAKNVHSPRGKQVLNKIDGYMPKQRTGSYFFIKAKRNSGLSGAEQGHKIQVTEAYSDTEEAATAWIRQQDNPDDYEIVFDRELTTDQRMYDVTSTHGGMYAGARKSEELKYVGRSDPHFADTFESLQHYINHIGRQYPAALYRMGAEHRLIKIANSLGIKAKDLSLHTVLGEAEKRGIPKSSKDYKMLKDIHDQVAFVNMIPTDGERNMAMQVQKLGRFFDNEKLNKIPGWERIPKYFYQKSAQNAQPVNLLRGLTFNHLLGMYNPAQILVQFSGSLISMAVDPIGYPKHVAKMMGWGLLDNIYTDPIAQKKIIDYFKSQGLTDYADEYEIWRKSGYLESVTQGNADYVSIFTKNLPYDAGILRKAMANHTMFYKMGELANTRVAFATSLARYKKVHKVKSVSPDDVAAMDEIGMWTEKYRLNMSRANQSNLNKGWLGAPLQFQQVISKYFEKVMPQVLGGTDEFTAWEKTRLAAIPTAMTGAVGIPFGQDLVLGFQDMLGIEASDLSEEETQLLKYGVVGWASNGALDLNVNFSDRMTLGGDVVRNIYEGLTTGKATWEWLGASGTVLGRYGKQMQYLAEAFSILPGDEEGEGDTYEDLVAYASIIGEAITDIPTVSRNVKQYYAHLFGDNPRYVKDGRLMWEWETMNKQTALLGMFGFQPTEMTEMYELSKEIKGEHTTAQPFFETDAKVILRIINTKLLSGGNVRSSKMYARLINNMIHNYGIVDQRKLMTQIWNLSMKKQMDQGNLMHQALMEALSHQQQGLDIINTLYARKLAETRNGRL